MVSAGIADYKVYARALLKVADIHKHYFKSNFKVATRAHIFEILHSNLKFISYTDTYQNI